MSEISVIVPVYKVEKYLKQCVDSILGQSFSDFDLILVDDGSPDNCPQICDEYASLDSRVHVIHQDNGGISAARNAGIDYSFNNSNSQWLAFIDSDDWIHKNYLLKLFEAVKHNDVKIAVCSNVCQKKPSDRSSVAKVYSAERIWCLRRINCLFASCKLIHKSLFSELRFPPVRVFEDEATMYKVHFTQNKVAFLKAPMYVYSINENSIMHTIAGQNLELQKKARAEQKEYLLENGFLKAAEPLVLWELIGDMRKSRDEGDTVQFQRKRNSLKGRVVKDFFVVPLPITQYYYIYRALWPKFFELIMNIKHSVFKHYR